jgi:3-dehydroquinate synthetase
VLSCADISGIINGRFKQRLLLISATGYFKAQFKNGGIGMHVSIPIHTQIVNGRQIPKIDISNFAVTFDTKKIVISIGGGILADIGDLFIGLFKSTIIRSIGNAINAKVPTTLENLI